MGFQHKTGTELDRSIIFLFFIFDKESIVLRRGAKIGT